MERKDKRQKLILDLKAFTIAEGLRHWINDGLMAVFFFAVGLEIKRELIRSELAEWRKAILPAAAAVGGMLIPAGVYALLNSGSRDE